MLDQINSRIAELEEAGKDLVQEGNQRDQVVRENQQRLAQIEAQLISINGALVELRALTQPKEEQPTEDTPVAETPATDTSQASNE